MSDQLPPIKDESSREETVPTDSQRTRPGQAVSSRQHLSTGQVQRVRRQQRQPTGYRPTQQRQRQQPPGKRDQPLYLPLWSLALMLLIVLAISFGIVFLVANLGGTAEEAAPIVVIITAEPSPTPPGIDRMLASPTISAGVEQTQPPSSDLALAGPTLPPVVFTPTPEAIAVGKVVEVIDVGSDELNIRDTASVIGSSVLFRAPEGTKYIIVEGPIQGDGFTWWKVQDPVNNTVGGWAVSNYLQATSQE